MVSRYQKTVGYLQGLNFIVFYLCSMYSSDLEVTQLMVYLVDTKFFVTSMVSHRISSTITETAMEWSFCPFSTPASESLK